MTGGGAYEILHVEDDDADALQFRTSMAQHSAHILSVTVASTMTCAAQILRDRHFDFVVCDLHLPDTIDPRDTLARLRVATDDPVIVLTGADPGVPLGLGDEKVTRVSKDAGIGPGFTYSPERFARHFDIAIRNVTAAS
ncbi:MAG: response regulator [Caulobacterales bacterium]|nr:response regulator [Caulobacterales bacterium]